MATAESLIAKSYSSRRLYEERKVKENLKLQRELEVKEIGIHNR